jgi:hypothetical protein
MRNPVTSVTGLVNPSQNRDVDQTEPTPDLELEPPRRYVAAGRERRMSLKRRSLRWNAACET